MNDSRLPPTSPLTRSLVSGQTKSIFHALDVDANGVIEWDEFSALMANRWLGQDGETDIDAAALLFADDSDVSARRRPAHHSGSGHTPSALAALAAPQPLPTAAPPPACLSC